MEIAVITVVGSIIVALIAFHAGRGVAKSQKNALDVETLIKLSTRVQDMSDELLKMKNQVEKFEDKNRVLWQYVYALIENMQSHDLTPPEPPAELETDPVLVKLLKKKTK